MEKKKEAGCEWRRTNPPRWQCDRHLISLLPVPILACFSHHVQKREAERASNNVVHKKTNSWSSGSGPSIISHTPLSSLVGCIPSAPGIPSPAIPSSLLPARQTQRQGKREANAQPFGSSQPPSFANAPYMYVRLLHGKHYVFSGGQADAWPQGFGHCQTHLKRRQLFFSD